MSRRANKLNRRNADNRIQQMELRQFEKWDPAHSFNNTVARAMGLSLLVTIKKNRRYK